MKKIKLSDKYDDKDYVEISVWGEHNGISVHERYGGDDGVPVSAGVTISKNSMIRLKEFLNKEIK